jgi:hypothetical protein
MRIHISRLVLVLLFTGTAAPAVLAQGGRGAGPAPPQSPQASAPIDLTGYWVSIVTEDWRWRMVTPPKGDYASVPINAAARKVADAWDPATDGSCLAYGAAALMRNPTRLHVTWENEQTLKVETDAGVQTRRFVFNATSAPGARTLQGHSVAEWERPAGGGRGGAPGGVPAGAPPGAPAPGPAPAGGRGGAPAPPPSRGGDLKVVTTGLSAGWLRKNGVPYSENTTLTEYFDRFTAPDRGEWLVVTTVVADPTYLTQEYVTSTHFRREPDAAKWDPTPCRPVS